MTRKFVVQLEDGNVEVDEGKKIISVFGRAQVKAQGIVAATLNQGLVSLHTQIQGECSLRPILVAEPLGRTVRRRTLTHMLQTLVANRGEGTHLVVGQSMAGGYFFEVKGFEGDLEKFAEELTGGLHHLAEAELEFSYSTVSLDGARRLLTDPYKTKAALLETWSSPMIVLVRLGSFVDIPHGPYAPNTGCGVGAIVRAYKTGILLDFQDNGSMPPLERSQRLWQCYRQTIEWNSRLEVGTVGLLNRSILNERETDVIRITEALHEKSIANIADEVARRDVRFVCIAGPSSSGKTTFMGRLSDHLRVNGIETHLLSLDDYYRDRGDCPYGSNGLHDFESPQALNLELLHQHFGMLLDGQPINLPRFDFETGRSLESDKTLQLTESNVIIVEGIHGNNPDLTAPLPESSRYRIFVNALNQLRIDEHNRILTSDTRLLRRIVRDRLYRGTSAEKTITQWHSVLDGEKRYIYPYQDHTDVMFNSALVYETAVLKTFAHRFLLEVPRRSPARVHAYRLLRFLDMFVPILPGYIPVNSILREFIGHRY